MSAISRLVAVHPASALAERPRLFAALQDAFDVRFGVWAGDADAVLAIVADPADGVPPELDGLAVPVLVAAAAAGAAKEEVRLADVPHVDSRLRGVEMLDRPAGSPLPAGAEILAADRSGPVWTRTRGAAPLDRVRSALPELAPDQVLFNLVWEHAVAAIALIQLLRELAGETAWRPRPLQAAIVFDDPNLRWRSYGFIDYRRLVAHADAHGYHAAMAMIPLDAGRPHGPTAELFARRRDRLSLVVHGNDHVKRELLRVHDAQQALTTAAQAMRRIDRFERRWGVRVDRVMMPPHGMCAQPMTAALADVGFDALSAIHPLPWTAELPGATLLAGWRPAQVVGACPVIPRIRFDVSRAEIALRAFLDHPVVLYGHHDDLAAGLEPLAEAARHVNALGDVAWCPVEEIALANYERRRVNGRIEVRPYARRVRVAAHDGVDALVVEAPDGAWGPARLHGWSLGGGPIRPFGTAVRLAPRQDAVVRLHGLDDVDASAVAAPPARPWPTLRRRATEVRDRMLPLRPLRSR